MMIPREAFDRTIEAIREYLEPIVWVHPATKAEWDAKAGDEAPLTHILIGPNRERFEIRESDLVPEGVTVKDRARLGVTP
jgi:hypothetical protein